VTVRSGEPPAVERGQGRTPSRTILLIGSYDTKAEELAFLADTIRAQGGEVLGLDVGILGAAPRPVAIPRQAVAAAGGSTIPALAALREEAQAMAVMSAGAAALARALVAGGRAHGMLALGGTMGTDLALDVALALPVGVPKYIVSTISFSPVIPPGRVAADVQMILWAGGLYGLNPICRATLAQAAGAVLGAARAAIPVAGGRPLVGVTSLGTTCLTYIGRLKPALERRGFDVAVFHSSGMGGRAFETLAAGGRFAAVFDLCLQEFASGLFGSMVSSGPDRLQGAGRAGIPQIVAPGAADLVDWPTWLPLPPRWRGRPAHVHNKLISSVTLTAAERRQVARAMARRLNAAAGPVHLVLPLRGIEAWDREHEFGHAPGDLAAFFETLRGALLERVAVTAIDRHINDPGFVDAALAVFDRWCEEGVVALGAAV